MKVYFIYFIYFIYFASPAYAYLDPGTGGFLIQMIVAFFISILIFFKSIWYKTKELILKFSKFFKKKNYF